MINVPFRVLAPALTSRARRTCVGPFWEYPVPPASGAGKLRVLATGAPQEPAHKRPTDRESRSESYERRRNGTANVVPANTSPRNVAELADWLRSPWRAGGPIEIDRTRF